MAAFTVGNSLLGSADLLQSTTVLSADATVATTATITAAGAVALSTGASSSTTATITASGATGSGGPVATVRIANVAVATAAPASKATLLSSTATNSTATVRIADVDATAGNTTATVRIAQITAIAGGSTASVRIANIDAYTPQNVYVWDGTQWVVYVAPQTGFSTMRATSVGSGGQSITGTGTSSAKLRSSGSGTYGQAGTLALSGGGTLLVSGTANVAPGNATGTLNLVGTGSLAIVGNATFPGAIGPVAVTPDPTNQPPRVLIELTGFAGTTVEITRNDPAGTFPVRLGHPATLEGGGWVGFDYEAPFGVPLTYTATPTSGSVVTSSPAVTLDVDHPWLLHPGIPDLSQPITVMTIGTKTTTTATGTHQILGRSTPIVITDGTRSAPVFPMQIKTVTAAQEQALLDLMGDSSPLLLQVASPFTGRTDYYWVSIGEVANDAPVRGYADTRRYWTMNATVVDAPSGLLQSQHTWADVLVEYATWADVRSGFATWRDVIIDAPVGG